MADIVERLLEQPTGKALAMAIDEIERLRTILQKIATLRHSNNSAASIAQSALDTMKALKE